MRGVLAGFGCVWALLGGVAAQSEFASMWGVEWHEGPWAAPVPVEGVNSTAHEVLLGANEGGLVVGRMHVQFDAQWWEQTAEWSPYVTSRLGRPDRFDAMEELGGWGLKSPPWPGLGEVMHLAYDESRTWAVVSAYRDAKREDVDLFLVSRTRSGWSAPRPLAELNTEYNEVFPNWIGGRLVFGSDRPGGAGGFDLYVADRWTSFREAERLGAPLNGPGDDVAAMGSREGWYVCTARRGGQGGLDVWWVGRDEEPAEVERATGWEARVLRADGGLWTGAVLELRGADGGIWLREEQGAEGMALSEVPLQNQFSAVVHAEAAGHGFLVVNRAGEQPVLRLPIQSGVPFVLNLLTLVAIDASDWVAPVDDSILPEAFPSVQILFDRNSSVLDSTALSELARWWARWMAGESTVTGELLVTGHADASGSKGRNAALSRERAEAVSDWLVSQGVPPNRIAVAASSTPMLLPASEWEAIARLQPSYRDAVPCDRRVEVRWRGW